MFQRQIYTPYYLVSVLDTESVNLGLGNSNLLYIAVELLLMHDSDLYIGPRIALIEEIEAHLHTQAQIDR